VGQGGGRGLVYEYGGRKLAEYAWGIGIVTKIEVESLIVFQGLAILANKGVHRAMVIGDFMIIKRALHHNNLPSNIHIYTICH
jgi:hypothetical protein